MSEVVMSGKWRDLDDLPRALRTMACVGGRMELMLTPQDALQLARIIEQHAQMKVALHEAAEAIADVTAKATDLEAASGSLLKSWTIATAFGVIFWSAVLAWWLA